MESTTNDSANAKENYEEAPPAKKLKQDDNDKKDNNDDDDDDEIKEECKTERNVNSSYGLNKTSTTKTRKIWFYSKRKKYI